MTARAGKPTVRIRDRSFPDPGDPPERRAGESPADRRTALAEHSLRRAVHEAVHGVNPHARGYVAELAWSALRDGAPLPGPLREWLQYVLEDLMQRDKVPHRNRGRWRDPHDALQVRARAAARFVELERTRRNLTVAGRIAIVARELALSEHTLADMRKTREFKDLVELYRDGGPK